MQIPPGTLERRHLAEVADCALRIVGIVRDYLPVQGDAGPKCSPWTIDQWYRQAVDYYRRIDQIRNPRRNSYHKGFSSAYQMLAPIECGPTYAELGTGLDALCEHYGWQGVSDDSRIPMSRCRDGETIPPVADDVLQRIDRDAKRLLSLVPCAAEPDQPPPPLTPSPLTSKTLTDTERNILRLVSRKPLKGEVIALKLGLNYDYARRLLSRLHKAGHLKIDDKGYRKKM